MWNQNQWPPPTFQYPPPPSGSAYSYPPPSTPGGSYYDAYYGQGQYGGYSQNNYTGQEGVMSSYYPTVQPAYGSVQQDQAATSYYATVPPPITTQPPPVTAQPPPVTAQPPPVTAQPPTTVTATTSTAVPNDSSKSMTEFLVEDEIEKFLSYCSLPSAAKSVDSPAGSRHSHGRRHSTSRGKSTSRSPSKTRAVDEEPPHKKMKMSAVKLDTESEKSTRHSVTMKEALQCLRELHEREVKMYHKDPEKHPDYYKRKRTWEREMKAKGFDQDGVGVQLAWKHAWRAMEEAIFKADWKMRKEQLLKNYLPDYEKKKKKRSRSKSLSDESSSQHSVTSSEDESSDSSTTVSDSGNSDDSARKKKKKKMKKRSKKLAKKNKKESKGIKSKKSGKTSTKPTKSETKHTSDTRETSETNLSQALVREWRKLTQKDEPTDGKSHQIERSNDRKSSKRSNDNEKQKDREPSSREKRNEERNKTDKSEAGKRSKEEESKNREEKGRSSKYERKSDESRSLLLKNEDRSSRNRSKRTPPGIKSKKSPTTDKTSSTKSQMKHHGRAESTKEDEKKMNQKRSTDKSASSRREKRNKSTSEERKSRHKSPDRAKSSRHKLPDATKSSRHKSPDGTKSSGHKSSDGTKSSGPKSSDGTKSSGPKSSDSTKSSRHKSPDRAKSSRHKSQDRTKSSRHKSRHSIDRSTSSSSESDDLLKKLSKISSKIEKSSRNGSTERRKSPKLNSSPKQSIETDGEASIIDDFDKLPEMDELFSALGGMAKLYTDQEKFSELNTAKESPKMEHNFGVNENIFAINDKTFPLIDVSKAKEDIRRKNIELLMGSNKPKSPRKVGGSDIEVFDATRYHSPQRVTENKKNIPPPPHFNWAMSLGAGTEPKESIDDSTPCDVNKIQSDHTIHRNIPSPTINRASSLAEKREIKPRTIPSPPNINWAGSLAERDTKHKNIPSPPKINWAGSLAERDTKHRNIPSPPNINWTGSLSEGTKAKHRYIPSPTNKHWMESLAERTETKHRNISSPPNINWTESLSERTDVNRRNIPSPPNINWMKSLAERTETKFEKSGEHSERPHPSTSEASNYNKSDMNVSFMSTESETPNLVVDEAPLHSQNCTDLPATSPIVSQSTANDEIDEELKSHSPYLDLVFVLKQMGDKFGSFASPISILYDVLCKDHKAGKNLLESFDNDAISLFAIIRKMLKEFLVRGDVSIIQKAIYSETLTNLCNLFKELHALKPDQKEREGIESVDIKKLAERTNGKNCQDTLNIIKETLQRHKVDSEKTNLMDLYLAIKKIHATSIPDENSDDEAKVDLLQLGHQEGHSQNKFPLGGTLNGKAELLDNPSKPLFPGYDMTASLTRPSITDFLSSHMTLNQEKGDTGGTKRENRDRSQKEGKGKESSPTRKSDKSKSSKERKSHKERESPRQERKAHKGRESPRKERKAPKERESPRHESKSHKGRENSSTHLKTGSESKPQMKIHHSSKLNPPPSNPSTTKQPSVVPSKIPLPQEFQDHKISLFKLPSTKRVGSIVNIFGDEDEGEEEKKTFAKSTTAPESSLSSLRDYLTSLKPNYDIVNKLRLMSESRPNRNRASHSSFKASRR